MFIPAHPMHVQDGTTAIYVAAANGHLMAVKLLIAAKAQADIQNKVRFNCFFLVKQKESVYSMVGQHCIGPVKRVTVKLLECC